MKLFDYTGLLKEGNQKLRVYLGSTADGDVNSATEGSENGAGISHINTKTPGAYHYHLTKAVEAYHRGKVERLEWLDGLTLKCINANVLRRADFDDDAVEATETLGTANAYFYVGMPFFEVPVVYEEMQYFSNNSKTHQWLINKLDEANAAQRAKAAMEHGSLGTKRGRSRTRLSSVVDDQDANDTFWQSSLDLIADPDLYSKTPNPTEIKHRRLARGLLQKGYLAGDMYAAMKPNRQERERLQNIFKSHQFSISTIDREILWKFRHSLVDEKRALTKFLLTIDFRNESEVNAAKDLLPKWKKIDVADALLLLGQHFENNNIVRRHAISILDDASDEEIDLFMLQLVQAMRYEQTPTMQDGLGEAPIGEDGNEVEGSVAGTSEERRLQNESLLSIFLIDRSLESFRLASSLYWFLKVEKEAPEDKKFSCIYNIFMDTLRKTPYGQKRLEDLERQATWLKQIGDAKQEATTHHGFGRSSRDAMLAKLKKSMHAGGKFADMLLFDPPVISPMDTQVMFARIVPDKTLMFKSKIYPVVYTFEVEPYTEEYGHSRDAASSDGQERRSSRQSKCTLSSRCVRAPHQHVPYHVH